MKVSEKKHIREDWVNGRKWRWWRAFSPRSLRYNRPLLILMIGIFVAVSAIPLSLLDSPRAQALSGTGPDPNDFRDPTNNPVQVAYQVDDTAFAGVTSLNILVYFSNNTANNLAIHSPGLTNLGVYDTIYGTSNIGASNPVVTTYTIQRINADGSVGANVATTTARRNDAANLNVNVPDNSLVIDPITKYYVAQLTATINTGYTDIANSFWVTSGGGDFIGQDSNSPATSFAMQAPRNLNKYIDWNLVFGADCTIQSNTLKQLAWYDSDNPDPFIQPTAFTFTLFDATAGANVSFTRITDASDGTAFVDAARTIVRPGSADKQHGSVEFLAQPYHKYVWRLSNVYTNNVLQFRKPFNDIYYRTDGCPRFTIQPNITGLPAQFIAGQSYTGFSAVALNLGPDASQPFNMTVTANQGTLTGTTSNTTTNAQLAVNTSFSYPFGVDVPATAANGSSICFTNTVTPARETGAPAAVTICRPVFKVFTPNLVGEASDIHAGGAVCSAAPTAGSGNVIGNAASDSKGQYVVSSEGTTSSFSSNNGGAGATISRYQSVCRPDLVAVAQTAIQDNPAIAYQPGPNYTGTLDNLSLLSLLSGKDVVYVPGNVTLTGGTVGRKLTIFAGGTITIAGSITRTAAGAVAASQPSLGLIAAGDINIAGAATTADAYIFSNGTINTCSVGPCNNTLNVHGFLMAHSLRLARIGPTTAPVACPSVGTVGECVMMTGHLYINPPRFFDNSGNINKTRSQGERPPLN